MAHGKTWHLGGGYSVHSAEMCGRLSKGRLQMHGQPNMERILAEHQIPPHTTVDYIDPIVWPCCINAYDDKWCIFIFLLKFRVLFWRSSQARKGHEHHELSLTSTGLRRKIHHQTLDAPRLVKSRRWPKNIVLGKNWDGDRCFTWCSNDVSGFSGIDFHFQLIF